MSRLRTMASWVPESRPRVLTKTELKTEHYNFP
jgi:hypothetical protein